MMVNPDVDCYAKKPYSSGKHAQKRKKQQPTENQKNTKTKLQAK